MAQDLRDDDGLIVVLVLRGVEQRQRRGHSDARKLLQGGLRNPAGQLLAVAPSELVPAVYAMAEPDTQICARPELLQPMINRRRFAGQPAVSTPEQRCIGGPEQKYINGACKKAPELGAFSLCIRLGRMIRRRIGTGTA